MNRYKALSIRYIKSNKHRTILTLVGIVLSLSLIATVAMFMEGAKSSQIEHIKKTEGYSYHILYRSYTDDIFSKVSNNPGVKTCGILLNDGVISYNGIQLQKLQADFGANTLYQYSLKEGTMPSKAGEACIDEWVRTQENTDVTIGQTIKIEGTEYTITGFLQTPDYLQREKTGRIFIFDEKPAAGGQLLVEIDPRADFEKTKECLLGLADKENVVENTSLTGLEMPGSNRSILTILLIIGAIVISATVIVIYNSFQMSVSERMKQLGLLRSIGATKKQIRGIVFREATILLAIAVPIGILLSIANVFILKIILNIALHGQNYYFMAGVDGGILLVSVMIIIIAVYAASFLPAKMVSKISPLAAVSNRAVIRKETIKRGKKRFKKIFNFKILMAVRNVRRNPERCRVLLLSVVVSSTLFITFATIMQDVLAINPIHEEVRNIDLQIELTGSGNGKKLDHDLIRMLGDIDNIQNIYIKYPDQYGMVKIDADQKIKEAGDIYLHEKEEGITNDYIGTLIDIYDEAALDTIEQYVVEGSLDTIKAGKGVVLVSDGISRDNANHELYIGRMTNLKVGDEIHFKNEDEQETFRIAAIVKNAVLEREAPRNTLNLITTDTVMSQYTDSISEPNQIGIRLSDPSRHFDTYTEVNQILQEYSGFTLIDYADMNEDASNTITLYQVLAYGFIIVITFISSINIVNIITMNVALRKKEVAVMRSIGMLKSDLKKMIVYEGIFYGLAGGLFGSFSGSLFTYIIYTVLREVVGIRWHLPWKLCLITILVYIVISYVSVLYPMKKITDDNIIESIRAE